MIRHCLILLIWAPNNLNPKEEKNHSELKKKIQLAISQMRSVPEDSFMQLGDQIVDAGLSYWCSP